MSILKEQLFEEALALNGEDKKYVISIEDNKIITRIKWMDATLFSPDTIIDEIKEFEYIVKLDDNGKYTELNKSVSAGKSFGRGGFKFGKNISIGHEKTYVKTIGFGRNNENGETGIVDVTFNSEEYKKPVRTLLKKFGYKKRMSTFTKFFIGSWIFGITVAIVAILILCQMFNKEPISLTEYEVIAKSNGYLIYADETLKKEYDYIKKVSIAVDEKDDYQIELFVLENSFYSKEIFESNKSNLQKTASTSTSVNSPKYEKYSASTSDNYLYIARIDNTVLFANVGIEHKDEVKEFIKEIGY